jgi:hypothetical protein
MFKKCMQENMHDIVYNIYQVLALLKKFQEHTKQRSFRADRSFKLVALIEALIVLDYHSVYDDSTSTLLNFYSTMFFSFHNDCGIIP